MGAIDLIGCVTKVTEYRIAVTMPNRMMVTATTTKAQIRTSSRVTASSADRFWLGGWFALLNLLLQDWGNKVFRACLRELATRLLALRGVEIVGVLAFVPVLLLAPRQQHQRQY
jgi:hypothetical protein